MDKIETKEYIKKYLHQKGYKITPQREIVISILLDHDEEHLSAEEVFLLAKEYNSGIGIATVYRTLEVLSDMEIIDKIIFKDGLARYDLQKISLKHSHHHLVCQKCNNIKEIDDDLLIDIYPILAQKYGFKLSDHQLTFYGICQNCYKEKGLDE